MVQAQSGEEEIVQQQGQAFSGEQETFVPFGEPQATPGLDMLSASANEFGVQVDMDTFDDLVVSTFGDNLPPDVLDMKTKVDAAREAALKAGEAARGRTNESQFEVLEDALRLRGGIGAQKIGTSEIFQKAGLTGFENLSQSMNARLGEMTTRYDQFSNSLRSANRDVNIKNQQLLDTYSNSLEEYKLLRDEYEFDVQRIDEREARIKEMEHDFAILDKEFAQRKEFAEFEAKFKDKESTGDSITDDLLSLGGLPSVNKPTSSSLGNGVVTAYGSYASDGKPIWKWGLDYQLEGGLGTPLKAPMEGIVIDTRTGFKPRDGKGFGNQIKVKFGDQEVWFSHLDQVGLKKGDKFDAGAILGTQGNTGKVFGPTGVHLDITMPKPGGGFYTAEEVAEFIGLDNPSLLGKEDIKEFQSMISRFPNVSQDRKNELYSQWKNGSIDIDEVEELLSEKIPTALEERRKNRLNVHLKDIEQGTDIDLSIEELKKTGEYTDREIFDYFRENISADKLDKVWVEELSSELNGFFNANNLDKDFAELFSKRNFKNAVVFDAIQNQGIKTPEEALKFLSRNFEKLEQINFNLGLDLNDNEERSMKELFASFSEKYPKLRKRTSDLINLLFK